ncbi:MAG: hypothetical protein ACRD5M_13015 [Candidatus Acidiferrales bacterium]
MVRRHFSASIDPVPVYPVPELCEVSFFYTYLFCIFLVDLARILVYTQHPAAYRNWYWSTQFLSIAAGYGVILEIVRQTLAPYKGAARFGSRVLWISFFAVLGYISYKSVSMTNWSASATGAELERDLRTVQAFVLAAILIVISYYGIEISRNLKGITLGYGAFIGLSIMNLAVIAYVGPPLEEVWRGLHLYVFFVPLVIWLVALWSYQASPSTAANTRLEADYESLVLRTKGLLRAMRDDMSGKFKE